MSFVRLFGSSLVSVAMLCALGSSAASATVIDFNALPAGLNPNPLVLSGTTFTTLGGFNYIVGALGPNSLCPSIASDDPADCSRDLEVLLDAPSSDISFTFALNNDAVIGNDIGDVQLFAGTTVLGTADIIVIDGSISSFDLLSLTGFSGVTRLVISTTDVGGLLYDDFTFTQSPIPEPGTAFLFGIGLVALASKRRR